MNATLGWIRTATLGLAAVVAVGLAGCGSSAIEADTGPGDVTSQDAVRDAAVDAPSDANADAQVTDASVDGAVDGGAATDGGIDGGMDGGLDAGDADAARDGFTPPDGAVTCSVGGLMGYCVDVASCTGGWTATPGFCPGAANIQCCIPSGSTTDAGWCPTDPNARPNEGLTEEPGEGTCPSGMISVATFCVDRFEASLVVVNADGTMPSWSPYYHPASGMRFKAVSLRSGVPQGYISGADAATACTAAGKRLCTDTEWLRACQGPTGTTYPYGNTREPGVCNDARAVHPAVQCFGTSASWIYSHLDYAGINQQANTVDPAGERTGCVTAEGAFDMMGNLHEWTSNAAGTFRGGFYADTVVNGNGCLYATTAHVMTYWDYSTGFRCCADPL